MRQLLAATLLLQLLQISTLNLGVAELEGKTCCCCVLCALFCCCYRSVDAAAYTAAFTFASALVLMLRHQLLLVLLVLLLLRLPKLPSPPPLLLLRLNLLLLLLLLLHKACGVWMPLWSAVLLTCGPTMTNVNLAVLYICSISRDSKVIIEPCKVTEMHKGFALDAL